MEGLFYMISVNSNNVSDLVLECLSDILVEVKEAARDFKVIHFNN